VGLSLFMAGCLDHHTDAVRCQVVLQPVGDLFGHRGQDEFVIALVVGEW